MPHKQKRLTNKNSRPVRLLRKVLDYNVTRAFQAVSRGEIAFPLETVNYSWDPLIPFPSSGFASPFSTMINREGNTPDLNQSMASLSSILTSASEIEEKIRTNPDQFVDQCKRVIKSTINYVPSQDQLAVYSYQDLQEVLNRVNKGLNKIDHYARAIEEYFENVEPEMSEAQTRNLDLLLNNLQATQLDIVATKTRLMRIQDDVRVDEARNIDAKLVPASCQPSHGFPNVSDFRPHASHSDLQLPLASGAVPLGNHQTPLLPRSVQSQTRLFESSSKSNTMWNAASSELFTSVPGNFIRSTAAISTPVLGSLIRSTASTTPSLGNFVRSSSAATPTSGNQVEFAPTYSNVMSATVVNSSPCLGNLGLALETSSVIEESEDWKSFQYRASTVLEKLILGEMKQLAELLENNINNSLTDGELKGLDMKESKEISRIQKNLVEKVIKIEAIGSPRSNLLIENALAANEDATDWVKSLNKMMRSREMWYESAKSLGVSLKLHPFEGYSSKMNIFEFIKTFRVITRNISPKDAADYLYQNYLGSDVQNMCKHVRHNLSDLCTLLIKKFGDPTRLLDEKKKLIRALTFPQKNNKDQQYKYFKSLSEILDQLESLTVEHSEDYPQLVREIYSHTCHSEIVRLLPEFVKNDYSREYVNISEELYGGDDLDGREAYRALSKFVHHRCRQVQLLAEKFTEEREKKEVPKKASVNVNLQPPVLNSNIKSSEDTWVKSVCFMHVTLHRRIRDCPMGKCDKFLNATPKERADKAREFGICPCCFLFKCFKKGKGSSCHYKDKIPTLVVCQPCAVKGVDLNVLLCSSHKSDSPSIRKALTSFLPEYEESTFIKTLTFSILNSKEKSSSVKQPKGDSKVFDTSKGSVLKKEDVLHKIVPENPDDSLYMLQQLSFNGRAITVLYDTGASASAVQGSFACDVGFNVVDSKPRVICVAGGGTVSTGYGIFNCILGPSEDGQYFPVDMLGMHKITSEIPLYDLSTMEKEVKIACQGTTLAKEPFPKFVGGDEVKLIIGIKDSFLMPKLVMTLPSGLMVFRSVIKDVYGSSLMFGGPHASVTQTHTKLNSGVNNFRVMFTKEFISYRDSVDCQFPCDSFPLSLSINGGESQSSKKDTFLPVHATLIEDSVNTGIHCDISNSLSCECRGSEYPEIEHSFCTCCFLPGMEKPSKLELFDSEVSNLNAQLDSQSCSSDQWNSVLSNLSANLNIENVNVARRVKPKTLEKELSDEENTGSRITYRCPRCTSCEECKSSCRTRETSIQEVLEEEIINKSIDIDFEKKVTFSRFPFRCDPVPYLKKLWNGPSNEKMAFKVFEQQRRKSPEVRAATVKFHKDVAEKGFVVPLKTLSSEVQQMIKDAPIRHYFLWRSVFREESLSTPCRIVVDPTMSGLNNVLCKGINCLNSLYMIVINWRSWIVGFSGDISKMYNTIRLYPSEYPYSLYYWSSTLDPSEEIEIWLYVVVTYGVVSSGNITTAALRRVAAKFKEQFSLAYHILTKYTYMDDISGGRTLKTDANQILRDIEEVISHAGFKMKMYCVSGETPNEKASADGIHTGFAGYLWAPLEDYMKIGFTEVNFHRKIRGSKQANSVPVETVEQVEELTKSIPLTRRILLGKVMELYDIIGIVEVIKSKLKIDMKQVVKYDYDEVLPDDLQHVWMHNISLIHQAKELRMPRSFIPSNAVDPENLEIMMFCDAAQVMCGVVAYCRMLMSDGTYEVRFITARSKSVSHTIPRNELEACVLAAETMFCILKAVGTRCKRYWILTDSEIALCWIANSKKLLKQFVFNRVQHIRYIIDVERFFHIPGEQNPSDVLTKGKTVKIEDIHYGSEWQCGPEWAKESIDCWPIRTYEQICANLSPDQSISHDKELLPTPSFVNQLTSKSMYCCKEKFQECHCIIGEKCCRCLLSLYKENVKATLEVVHWDHPDSMAIPDIRLFAQIRAFSSMELSQNEIVGYFDGIKVYRTSKNAEAELVTNNAEVSNTSEDSVSILNAKSEVVSILNAKSEVNIGNTLSDSSLKSKCSSVDENGLLTLETSSPRLIEPKHPYVVDLVTKGFKQSFGALAYVMKFISKLKHNLHKKEKLFSETCNICQLQFAVGGIPELLGIKDSFSQLPGREGVFTSPYDQFLAWKTLCKIGTQEVKATLTNSQKEKYVESDEGILYSGGRLSQLHTVKNTLYERFQFVKPVILVSSQLTYSIVMHMHWLHNHPGVEQLVLLVLQVIHVERLRTLVKYIRKSCPRCRYILKKEIKIEVSNQHKLAYTSAPPFYSAQMDVACGFLAYDVKHRVTKSAYLLVIVCNLTSAVSLTVLENLSTDQVLFGLERHSARHGWPKYLLPDRQSSFSKLEDLRISFRDLQGRLFYSQKIYLDFCTPNNHAEHGKVEARVKIIKTIFEKAAETGKKHSYIEWETVAQRTAAAMNSLPIARSGDSRNPQDMEDFGLITPFHFLLGLNPNRLLSDSATLLDTRSNMLDIVNNTNEFLHGILLDHLHRFIPSCGKSKNDKVPEPGDVVIFVHVDNIRARNRDWKFGRIQENYVNGNPGRVRIVYRNSNETTYREIERHLKDVCLISALDDIDFNTEAHRLALEHQNKRYSS